MSDLRVKIAQMNPIVGAIKSNTSRATEIMKAAESEEIEILVFPEMFITGYPALDLILEDHFVHANMKAVMQLAQQSGETITLIGAIHDDGRDTYNGVAVLQHGKIIKWIHKSLLPTYDVFDEWRYFKPGRDNQPLRIRTRTGRKLALGIHVCEDLWDEKIDYKICDILAKQGVDLFINISASPFQTKKYDERSRLVINKVKRFNKPYIYVNQVGGQDQLVFDGQSLVADAHGNWIHVSPQFEEDIVDLDIPLNRAVEAPFEYQHPPIEEELFNGLVLGVKDYFRKTGHSKAVLGLSGGIDSALTACIAAEALGAQNVLGVAMPSRYSSAHSLEDAVLLAKKLELDYIEIPIESIHQTFQESYLAHLGAEVDGLPEENLQARIRGNILMTLSNRDGSLLLTTGNKTEIALGYCTLYGDMSGGLAVISDIGKRAIYHLADYYNRFRDEEIIPRNTIDKPPSAELAADQVDPFDYKIVAPLVNRIIEEHPHRQVLIEEGYDADLVDDLIRKIRLAEYKRQQMPPGIRVTSKAFGIGRRMPIVNHYDL